MWAIDRANLILLGVALGIIAVVGIVVLLSPSPSAVIQTSAAREVAEATPENPPAEAEPAVVPAPTEMEAATGPAPEPASPAEEASSSAPIVDGIIHTGEYAHAMEAGGFRVYWANDANVLRIGLFSPGTGYVAIGLDPDRRMQGANFIIAAVRNGQLEIRDDFGTGSLSHGPDVGNGGTDDILAAAGKELSGQTTVEFIIPLDSGDPFDKPLQPGATYDILVAFHDTNDSFATRHSERGSGQIRLDDVRP